MTKRSEGVLEYKGCVLKNSVIVATLGCRLVKGFDILPYACTVVWCYGLLSDFVKSQGMFGDQ